MKKIPILYKSKEECCGCSACYSVCSRKAITMVEDKEGFAYPVIEKRLCVGCQICIGVCPIKINSR